MSRRRSTGSWASAPSKSARGSAKHWMPLGSPTSGTAPKTPRSSSTRAQVFGGRRLRLRWSASPPRPSLTSNDYRAHHPLGSPRRCDHRRRGGLVPLLPDPRLRSRHRRRTRSCAQEGASTMTWTREAVEETAAKFREKSIEIMRTQGEHRPMAFLFATRDPETGQPKDMLLPVIPQGSFDNEGKEVFSLTLRVLAYASKAGAVIFITEMWTVPAASMAEVQQWAGRVHEHPNRVEALYMSVEHVRFGEKAFHAVIKRTPDGKPDLQPWESEDWKQSMGRFTHLLPPA